MAITLIVNPGSTSKKYALYTGATPVFSMRFEETGAGFGVCRERDGEQQICEDVEAKTYKKAIESFLEEAVSSGIIPDKKAIEAVGVRIVAPGERFFSNQRIDDVYIDACEKLGAIVPLHIPAILDEIYSLRAILKHLPLYGISDSAFHASIPKHRRRMGINREDSDTYELFRYGYHGLSMASIARRTESFFGVEPDRVVVVHVGGGISATALHYRESVDTSMGYSPASGIMMGSRAGHFDADALVALMEHKGMRSISTLANYLNREGGFVGTVGFSDLRLVLNKYTEGNADAAEALQMLRYQLHRQIGGHAALLGGIDAFVFTGTAVVRNPFLRTYLIEGLNAFGLVIDPEKNDTLIGKEGMIHSDHSDISIGVMKNDEMGEIARSLETLLEQER